MKPVICSDIELHTSLSLRSVSELRKLAAGFYIKGTSKMRKAELINVIVLALKEPERLRELLLVTDPDTWSLFRTAVELGTATVRKTANTQYRILAELGYICCEDHEQGTFVFLPQEIRDVFASLCKDGFLQQKARYDLLHSFVEAAVNLYGIIEQDAFVALFNHYNEDSTTIEELFPCMVRHIAVDASYCLWEEYIVRNDFEENDFQDVRDLVLQIGSKPRYTPDREEFLRYSDPNYFERNLHIDELVKFLTSKLDLPFPLAEEIAAEIQYACAIEAPTQAVLNILDEYNVPVKEEFFQELGQRIVSVSNNTRLWSNNGHTPNELYQQLQYYFNVRLHDEISLVNLLAP